MSWLDANEVFLMEVVSRDRIDDLRSTIDVTDESADGARMSTLAIDSALPVGIDVDGQLLGRELRHSSTTGRSGSMILRSAATSDSH